MQTSWDLNQTLSDSSPENIAKLKQESENLINTFAKKYLQNSLYLEDEKVLLESLSDYENIIGNDPANILGQYYSLSASLNQSDPVLLAQISQLTSWSTALSNKIQFYTLSLAKISKTKQSEFLNSKTLVHYHKFLKQIFDNARYDLSEPEEKILSTFSRFGTRSWVKLTSRLLGDEQVDGKNLTQLISEVSSLDKKTRDQANTCIVNIFEKYKVVAEVEINNLFNFKKENDTLRGISRPDLLRHISDDINSTTVDALRTSVIKNFEISNEFYKLKSQLMGQKKLAYHERNVPYISKEKNYTFQEAYDLIYKVFNTLSPDFSKVLQDYFESGKVDVFPKIGKSSGAFCGMGTKNTHGYVLLNHTNKLQDVLTLAHEFGHAVNHEFIRANSSPIYMDNSLATAEVASTFFEDFVLKELEKTATKEELLGIYVNRLGDDISTIFRQIACYEFEWELHQTIRDKGHLSWQEIGEIFQKHMSSYMGEHVEQGPGSNLFWIYWSHIRSYFYVYSYSSGLLISKSLQSLVNSDKSNLTKVKKFLSTGTNISASNIFLEMGINIDDPSFWQNGLNEIRSLLEKTRALAIELGKI